MDDVNKLLRDSADQGKSSMIWHYLAKGANIDSQSIEGNTALHFAADRGHSKVVMILLESGANIKIINSEGKSAWDLASQKTHQVVLTFLELQAFIERNRCSFFFQMNGFSSQTVHGEFFSVMNSVDLATSEGNTEFALCAAAKTSLY